MRSITTKKCQLSLDAVDVFEVLNPKNEDYSVSSVREILRSIPCRDVNVPRVAGPFCTSYVIERWSREFEAAATAAARMPSSVVRWCQRRTKRWTTRTIHLT